MQRAYYSENINEFLLESESSILGKLSINHSNKTLEELQKNAWLRQIKILKDQLKDIVGHVYFEFSIPRMGKRVDNIVIVKDAIFIIEFKVGSKKHENHAVEQVIDYSLDLSNFHEGSHKAKLVPVLISTNAENIKFDQNNVLDFNEVVKTNSTKFKDCIPYFTTDNSVLNASLWENSIYKPTPTIVEAAQALYKGHNVEEISRSDSGAINLSRTTNELKTIIDSAKNNSKKSICFVTGVPGAGKTLAGLNIANERMKSNKDEHAVFLSGNGPLVYVLREALARDMVKTYKERNEKIIKKNAKRQANSFIQNIHHFRDEYLKSERAPIEKVVVFDEAQRAWTKEKASSFIRKNKGKEDFNLSEPEFLIQVMDRHKDWCTIVCLIGGGQEINTGEAGMNEWIDALRLSFPDWNIHFSNQIIEHVNYIQNPSLTDWLRSHGTSHEDLHLSVSLRSFRAENLSNFVHALLDLKLEEARKYFEAIHSKYPIMITRDLTKAKEWLKSKAKGSERTGIISSSGARRLRTTGINVKNSIAAEDWFLNDKNDIRSSYYLEDVATEFDIQGLEIDWACIGWGANLRLDNMEWKYKYLHGTKWNTYKNKVDQDYLKNSYRVLLTRARQGIIIFIPEGNQDDYTRLPKFYDSTYSYFKEIGISEL